MVQKTLMILGANSFAGGCLVKQALQAGYKVIGVNRSAEQPMSMTPYRLAQMINVDYTFYQLDLNQDLASVFKLIEDYQVDFIVDLAGQGMVAESWQNPEQWFQTNVVAKSKLIHFLQSQKQLKRYLKVSTPEVYGSTDNLLTESNVYHPSTPYAVSHAAIDMNIQAYVKQYNFPAVITRFSNFYGPTQQLYRIIPRTIIYSKLNNKLQLHGGGISTRAFIHGDDAADGMLAALEKGQNGEIYHFSTDEFVTIRNLVERIFIQLGADFATQVEVSEDRPGKDLKYLMDDNKAKTELAWQPKYSLDAGIGETIAWIESNWSEIKALPLNYIHKV